MDKITALYCRFAYGDVPEIIEEQKSLLQKAAEENGLTNTRFYVDSGVSGLTMDRPAFNELMADMENGLIEAVIAQDASRICRRASVSTEYIEEIFPSHGVRFLSAEVPSDKSLMDILLAARDNGKENR